MNAHLFHRRRWTTLTCLECLRPWPCDAFRLSLPLDSPARRAAAVAWMTDETRRARAEYVGLELPALVSRFFWWLSLDADGDAARELAEVVVPHGPAPRT